MDVRARLFFGSLAAVVWIAAAQAQDAESLEYAFENTIRITSGSSEVFIYFNRDGTFTSSGTEGDKFGTWKIKDDNICTKIKSEPESCGVIEAGRRVGDQWEHTLDGETITIEIIKGR